MIELRNIMKVVKVDKNTVPILNNINLNVENNDFLIITGKSGSGKSTLLNVIGGFDKKNSGNYIYNGIDIKGESSMLEIRRDIGYVTQNFALIHDETVERNILLALGVKKSYKSFVKNIDETLDLLDISKLKNVKVSKLSGGEKQRVAIARAIIRQPKLLLFDEPTGNLDEENSKIVIDIIKKLHKDSKTIIMVTHEPEYVNLGNKSIKLVDGRIE